MVVMETQGKRPVKSLSNSVKKEKPGGEIQPTFKRTAGVKGDDIFGGKGRKTGRRRETCMASGGEGPVLPKTHGKGGLAIGKYLFSSTRKKANERGARILGEAQQASEGKKKR